MDPIDTLATLGSVFLVICIIVIVLAAIGTAVLLVIVKRDRDEHRARIAETRGRIERARTRLGAD